MKEFSVDLSEALTKGKRPDYRQGFGTGFMDNLFNCKPSPFGLLAHTPIKEALSLSDVQFPFPQLFRGKAVTLLAYETTVYTIDESDWSTTQLTLYNYIDRTTVGTVPKGGGIWHFVDFGTSWLLIKDGCTVFKLGDVTNTLVQTDVTVKAGCQFRGRSILGGFSSSDFWSGNNFDWDFYLSKYQTQLPSSFSLSTSIDKNYVMWSTIGGGAGDLYWLLYPEKSIFGEYGGTPSTQDISIIGVALIPTDGDKIVIGTETFTFKTTPTSDHHVEIGATIVANAVNFGAVLDAESRKVYARRIFTSFVYVRNRKGGDRDDITVTITEANAGTFVGGADITGGSGDTVHDIENPLFIEHFERNEMGFMPMPFQGSIQAILPMKEGVIVYGEDGVAVLTHNLIDNELSTFGFEKLSKIGIPTRGCAVLNDNEDNPEQVYLGNDGKLRVVDANFKIQTLGYKEYFYSKVFPEGTITGDIVMSYNEEEDEFYVADGTGTEILTRSGLGHTSKKIISCFNLEGHIVGIFVDSQDNQFEAVVDKQDLGFSGQQHIESLELSGEWGEVPQVCVYFRYDMDKEGVWRKSDWVQINNSGSARVNISANFFMPAIRVTRYNNVRIHSFRAKWKAQDRRYVRGTEASVQRFIEREFV